MIFFHSRPKALAALVATGLCFSSTAAWSNPLCQAGAAGCVLPIADTPPPPVAEAAPVVESHGLGILPFLGALALLGALLYLILHDHNHHDHPNSP